MRVVYGRLACASTSRFFQGFSLRRSCRGATDEVECFRQEHLIRLLLCKSHLPLKGKAWRKAFSSRFYIKTKRPAAGSWGPVLGVFVSVENERYAQCKINCQKVFEGRGGLFSKSPPQIIKLQHKLTYCSRNTTSPVDASIESTMASDSRW